jgi:23S rRNA (cytosine1962-C5)-methyltransferase
VQTRQGDAFEVLKGLREARERFDVVIVDPPAFVKRRKDFKEGALAYRRTQRNGDAGAGARRSAGVLLLLATAPARDAGPNSVARIAASGSQSDVMLEQGRQGPDHPVPPAIPETDYLKMIV